MGVLNALFAVAIDAERAGDSAVFVRAALVASVADGVTDGFARRTAHAGPTSGAAPVRETRPVPVPGRRRRPGHPATPANAPGHPPPAVAARPSSHPTPPPAAPPPRLRPRCPMAGPPNLTSSADPPCGRAVHPSHLSLPLRFPRHSQLTALH